MRQHSDDFEANRFEALVKAFDERCSVETKAKVDIDREIARKLAEAVVIAAEETRRVSRPK